MLKVLKFNNLKFHVGENITIRRGIKWATEEAAFIRLKEGLFPTVQELRTKVMRARDIPSDDLMRNQNPSCRNHLGLIENLKKNLWKRF